MAGSLPQRPGDAPGGQPAPIPLARRLRRLLLDTGGRDVPFGRPGGRAFLALAATAAIAALGTAAWHAYVDSRIVAVTDPRELYVENARRRIQAATDAALAGAAPRDQPAAALLVIRVNHQGGLVHVAMARSSGDPGLDGLARRIVGSAAPFDPFPPEVRRTTRTVEIVSEFRFQ